MDSGYYYTNSYDNTYWRTQRDYLRVYIGISTTNYQPKYFYGTYNDYTLTYTSDFLYLYWSTSYTEKGFEGYVEREGQRSDLVEINYLTSEMFYHVSLSSLL